MVSPVSESAGWNKRADERINASRKQQPHYDQHNLQRPFSTHRALPLERLENVQPLQLSVPAFQVLDAGLKQNRRQVRASGFVVKPHRHQRHRLNNSKPTLKAPAEQPRVPSWD
jgi:hypothetical protein